MKSPKWWSRRTGWAALAIAALCALVLIFLVLSSAIEAGKSMWIAFFLLVVGGVAAAAALFATDGAPVGAERWSAWLRPRPMSILLLALFAGIGFMIDIMSLFEPRPAVESRPGALEEGVNQIRAAVTPDPPTPARVRLKLLGLWGEPGCGVTYRFRIEEGALIVDSGRRPPGTAPYHLVATIVRADGDVMDVAGEEPRAARGSAATFTYTTNGLSERLIWDDQIRPVPLELDRCA